MIKLTPMRAIRYKCLECCQGKVKDVSLCTFVNCPLYVFRFGKRPTKEVREKWERDQVKRYDK